MLKNRILGIIFITISIILPIYHNYHSKQKIVINQEKVSAYIDETTSDSIPQTTSVTIKKVIPNEYIAVLSIPTINLKRGLVNPTSYANNVKYNIEIIEGSSLPDQINTNLVLAAHNGNSEVSFFKDLDKLALNSLIEIYYNGTKYIYELAKIDTVPKTGQIKISRDNTRNTITLVTCKKNSDTEQVIYIGYLKEKIPY